MYVFNDDIIHKMWNISFGISVWFIPPKFGKVPFQIREHFCPVCMSHTDLKWASAIYFGNFEAGFTGTSHFWQVLKLGSVMKSKREGPHLAYPHSAEKASLERKPESITRGGFRDERPCVSKNVE